MAAKKSKIGGNKGYGDHTTSMPMGGMQGRPMAGMGKMPKGKKGK